MSWWIRLDQSLGLTAPTGSPVTAPSSLSSTDLHRQVGQAAGEWAEAGHQHADKPDLRYHPLDPMSAYGYKSRPPPARTPERCAQAFTVAATAVALERRCRLAHRRIELVRVPGRAATFELPHSAPLADRRSTPSSPEGGSPCAQCRPPRATEADLGVRIAARRCSWKRRSPTAHKPSSTDAGEGYGAVPWSGRQPARSVTCTSPAAPSWAHATKSPASAISRSGSESR